MIQAPRGTFDVLPDEQPLWQRIVGTAEEVCAVYGYGRIQTPGFEETELFRRTSGEGSDIVQKEMYTFTDRGGRSLTLRAEGTAPNARAYLEHGLHREPQPVKTYMIAPMYRYAAPQKGRYREHYQWSVEAVGSDDPAVDAEIVQLYVEFLRRLGVRGYSIELNSIGDRECRPDYIARLEAWLDEHAEALDEDARQKRKTSPLRVFDVKSPAVQEALAAAPKIGESLCGSCQEHFAEVRRYLDAYGIEYQLVPTLVRGLDYYTRTTFEFIGEALGAQSSLVGGGRYDYLVEELGGPPTPGIGFGAGIERLRLQLEEEGLEAERQPVDVFFAFEAPERRQELLPVLAQLRRDGRSAETDYAGRSLKGQLTQAQRVGARTTIIVRAESFTIRRRGQADSEVESLEEVEL
ncbi:MAG TPA: histidine--tRNA ligase [Gaiellaceae bacterium]|nr:histidine--tRNA ligase [Gaiellaceae bacterium]